MEVIVEPLVWDKLSDCLQWCAGRFGRRIANRFQQQLRQAMQRLSRFPRMAPVEELLSGRPLEYRSLLVHPHFKLIYYIDEAKATVYVVDMWDVRQNN